MAATIIDVSLAFFFIFLPRQAALREQHYFVRRQSRGINRQWFSLKVTVDRDAE
jgi:hypothetical protein